MELEERFWSKVDWDASDPVRCWPWLAGTRERRGIKYGAFWLKDGNVTAHRLAYEFEAGDIPEGHVIDHQEASTS